MSIKHTSYHNWELVQILFGKFHRVFQFNTLSWEIQENRTGLNDIKSSRLSTVQCVHKLLTLCLFIDGKAFCVTSLNGGAFMNVVNKFLLHQQLLWDLESSINDHTRVPECFSQSIVTWLITPVKHAPLVCQETFHSRSPACFGHLKLVYFVFPDRSIHTFVFSLRYRGKL